MKAYPFFRVVLAKAPQGGAENASGQRAKTAAIVLSGCGVYDGSEIHEAVIALLNLEKMNVNVSFFAPDKMQAHTLNHLEGSEIQNRNVLQESARIARGNIKNLNEFKPENFDLLIFPGGFGAAKNLCDFASKGADCVVDKSVENAINSARKANLPIGFMCISPVIAAKVIGDGVKLTIGIDSQTANAIEAMGAKHIQCDATSFVEDKDKKIFSTPAYMCARNTVEIDKGTSAMIEAMLKNA